MDESTSYTFRGVTIGEPGERYIMAGPAVETVTYEGWTLELVRRDATLSVWRLPTDIMRS